MYITDYEAYTIRFKVILDICNMKHVNMEDMQFMEWDTLDTFYF